MRKQFLIVALLIACAVHARDGDFDRSFADGGQYLVGGVEYTYQGPYRDSASFTIHASGNVAMQSNGKFVVASPTFADAGRVNAEFSATRVTANGSADFAFGDQAFSTVSFDRSNSSFADTGTDMVVQPDDSILIAGTIAGPFVNGYANLDMGIAKLTPDGQLDTTWANSGKALVAFDAGGSLRDFGLAIDVQPDHKILLAGSADTVAGHAMAIARMTASGFPDTSFNGTGRLTLDFGVAEAVASRARVLTDGTHILVVGAAQNYSGGGQQVFALARLNIGNGSLDSGFGTGGEASYNFADHIPSTIEGVSVASDFAELPDGRLMVCGSWFSSSGSSDDFVCMQFLADGAPDPAFAPVLIPFNLGGGFHDYAFRVRRDAQGRFVVAGVAQVAVVTYGDTYNYNCAIVRLTPSGQLDPSFGVEGRVLIDSRFAYNDINPDYDNGCFGLLLQADGKIVAAGWNAIGTVPQGANTLPDTLIKVVRLIGDTIFDDRFGN